MGWRSRLQKAQYIASVVVINTSTLVFAVWVFLPAALPFSPFALEKNATKQPAPVAKRVPEPFPRTVISGKPTRIEVIAPDNDMHIDLLVEDGYFDSQAQKWTLTDKNAYFAMPSMIANDTRGTTLIYGHNEKHLFSHLSSLKQNMGAYALIHTNTGKTFRYNYADAKDLQPDDVSVFTDSGAPTLIVQTCVGDWFELRRMYRFTFVSVEATS